MPARLRTAIRAQVRSQGPFDANGYQNGYHPKMDYLAKYL
jgi:hypothetical protein